MWAALAPKQQKNVNVKEVSRSIIQILDGSQVPEELVPIKNNILLILFCITVYAIYQLFSDYIDTILLAALSGVAFRQLRARFVNMWERNKQKAHKKTSKDVVLIVLEIILFLLLPWIRHQSKKHFSEISFQIDVILRSFVYSTNPVVRIAQAYLFMHVAYSLMGPKLEELFTCEVLTEGRKKSLRILFAFLTIVIVVLVLVTVIVVITIEVGRASNLVTTSIEQFYNCQFYPPPDSPNVPCTEKISANLSLYLPKIQNQTEYNLCIQAINNTQHNYLGFDLVDYQENICAFQQQVKSVSPGLVQSITLKETGAMLASAFGIIARFFNFIVDASFSITTFFSIFIVMVNYLEFTFSSKYLNFFGNSRQKLVEDITNIISATIFIALEHLAMGILLFEVLRFSEINVILAIFLSATAFVPLVKPSLLVLFIGPLIAWLSGNYIAPIVCCLLYAYGSSLIYQKYYSQVSLHKVIINLSVVFGIYQFGVSGIFYGPLLITLFECVSTELYPDTMRASK